MSSLQDLSGALWLRPGVARPHNLRSTRPDAVRRLTRGLPAARLAATLGRLFSLCSHAHALCAGMAVDAARGHANVATSADRARHAQLTLREHLKSLWLDWPRRLAGTREAVPAEADAAAAALASCPAFARVPGGVAPWLEAQALGLPGADWLRHWDEDPAAWLADWSRRTALPVARALGRALAVAGAPLAAPPALAVHADASQLRGFAEALRTDGDALTRQPQWQRACAETGVWTRRHQARAARLDSVALRLAARLAEVVRLALPEAPARSGAAWLQLGAMPLGDGEGIAWLEMSRGLLVHHVQLDGFGEQARIAACHVIAPTEWNFHARGAVAAQLEALPEDLGDPADDAAARRLGALLAAYDPCVPCHVEHRTRSEARHA